MKSAVQNTASLEVHSTRERVVSILLILIFFLTTVLSSYPARAQYLMGDDGRPMRGYNPRKNLHYKTPPFWSTGDVQPNGSPTVDPYEEVQRIGQACSDSIMVPTDSRNTPYQAMVGQTFMLGLERLKNVPSVSELKRRMREVPNREALQKDLAYKATQTHLNQSYYSWKKHRQNMGGSIDLPLGNLTNDTYIAKAVTAGEEAWKKQPVKANIKDPDVREAQLLFFNSTIQEMNNLCKDSHSIFSQLMAAYNNKMLQDPDWNPLIDDLLGKEPGVMYMAYGGTQGLIRDRLNVLRKAVAFQGGLLKTMLNLSIFGKQLNSDTPLQDHVGIWNALSCVENGQQLKPLPWGDAEILSLTNRGSNDMDKLYVQTLKDVRKNITKMENKPESWGSKVLKSAVSPIWGVMPDDHWDPDEVLEDFVDSNPASIEQSLVAYPDVNSALVACDLIHDMRDKRQLKETITLWLAPITIIATAGAFAAVEGATAAVLSVSAMMLNGYFVYSTVMDLALSYDLERRLKQSVASDQIDPDLAREMLNDIGLSRPFSWLNLALSGLGLGASIARAAQLAELQGIKNMQRTIQNNYRNVQGGATAQRFAAAEQGFFKMAGQNFKPLNPQEIRELAAGIRNNTKPVGMNFGKTVDPTEGGMTRMQYFKKTGQDPFSGPTKTFGSTNPLTQQQVQALRNWIKNMDQPQPKTPAPKGVKIDKPIKPQTGSSPALGNKPGDVDRLLNWIGNNGNQPKTTTPKTGSSGKVASTKTTGAATQTKVAVKTAPTPKSTSGNQPIILNQNLQSPNLLTNIHVGDPIVAPKPQIYVPMAPLQPAPMPSLDEIMERMMNPLEGTENGNSSGTNPPRIPGIFQIGDEVSQVNLHPQINSRNRMAEAAKLVLANGLYNPELKLEICQLAQTDGGAVGDAARSMLRQNPQVNCPEPSIGSQDLYRRAIGYVHYSNSPQAKAFRVVVYGAQFSEELLPYIKEFAQQDDLLGYRSRYWLINYDFGIDQVNQKVGKQEYERMQKMRYAAAGMSKNEIQYMFDRLSYREKLNEWVTFARKFNMSKDRYEEFKRICALIYQMQKNEKVNNTLALGLTTYLKVYFGFKDDMATLATSFIYVVLSESANEYIPLYDVLQNTLLLESNFFSNTDIQNFYASVQLSDSQKEALKKFDDAIFGNNNPLKPYFWPLQTFQGNIQKEELEKLIKKLKQSNGVETTNFLAQDLNDYTNRFAIPKGDEAKQQILKLLLTIWVNAQQQHDPIRTNQELIVLTKWVDMYLPIESREPFRKIILELIRTGLFMDPEPLASLYKNLIFSNINTGAIVSSDMPMIMKHYIFTELALASDDKPEIQDYFDRYIPSIAAKNKVLEAFKTKIDFSNLSPRAKDELYALMYRIHLLPVGSFAKNRALYIFVYYLVWTFHLSEKESIEQVRALARAMILGIGDPDKGKIESGDLNSQPESTIQNIGGKLSEEQQKIYDQILSSGLTLEEIKAIPARKDEEFGTNTHKWIDPVSGNIFYFVINESRKVANVSAEYAMYKIDRNLARRYPKTLLLNIEGTDVLVFKRVEPELKFNLNIGGLSFTNLSIFEVTDIARNEAIKNGFLPGTKEYNIVVSKDVIRAKIDSIILLQDLLTGYRERSISEGTFFTNCNTVAPIELTMQNIPFGVGNLGCKIGIYNGQSIFKFKLKDYLDDLNLLINFLSRYNYDHHREKDPVQVIRQAIQDNPGFIETLRKWTVDLIRSELGQYLNENQLKILIENRNTLLNLAKQLKNEDIASLTQPYSALNMGNVDLYDFENNPPPYPVDVNSLQPQVSFELNDKNIYELNLKLKKEGQDGDVEKQVKGYIKSNYPKMLDYVRSILNGVEKDETAGQYIIIQWLAKYDNPSKNLAQKWLDKRKEKIESVNNWLKSVTREYVNAGKPEAFFRTVTVDGTKIMVLFDKGSITFREDSPDPHEPFNFTFGYEINRFDKVAVSTASYLLDQINGHIYHAKYLMGHDLIEYFFNFIESVHKYSIQSIEEHWTRESHWFLSQEFSEFEQNINSGMSYVDSAINTWAGRIYRDHYLLPRGNSVSVEMNNGKIEKIIATFLLDPIFRQQRIGVTNVLQQLVSSSGAQPITSNPNDVTAEPVNPKPYQITEIEIHGRNEALAKGGKAEERAKKWIQDHMHPNDPIYQAMINYVSRFLYNIQNPEAETFGQHTIIHWIATYADNFNPDRALAQQWLDARKKLHEEFKKLLFERIKNGDTSPITMGDRTVTMEFKDMGDHREVILKETDQPSDIEYLIRFSYSIKESGRVDVTVNKMFLATEKDNIFHHSRLMQGHDMMDFMFYYLEDIQHYFVQNVFETWMYNAISFNSQNNARYYANIASGMTPIEAVVNTWPGQNLQNRGFTVPAQPTIDASRNVSMVFVRNADAWIQYQLQQYQTNHRQSLNADNQQLGLGLKISNGIFELSENSTMKDNPFKFQFIFEKLTNGTYRVRPSYIFPLLNENQQIQSSLFMTRDNMTKLMFDFIEKIEGGPIKTITMMWIKSRFPETSPNYAAYIAQRTIGAPQNTAAATAPAAGIFANYGFTNLSVKTAANPDGTLSNLEKLRVDVEFRLVSDVDLVNTVQDAPNSNQPEPKISEEQISKISKDLQKEGADKTTAESWIKEHMDTLKAYVSPFLSNFNNQDSETVGQYTVIQWIAKYAKDDAEGKLAQQWLEQRLHLREEANHVLHELLKDYTPDKVFSKTITVQGRSLQLTISNSMVEIVEYQIGNPNQKYDAIGLFIKTEDGKYKLKPKAHLFSKKNGKYYRSHLFTGQDAISFMFDVAELQNKLITQIEASLSPHPDPMFSQLYYSYFDAVEAGVPPMDAAMQSWEGQLFAKYGFRVVSVDAPNSRNVEDRPVVIIFERNQVVVPKPITIDEKDILEKNQALKGGGDAKAAAESWIEENMAALKAYVSSFLSNLNNQDSETTGQYAVIQWIAKYAKDDAEGKQAQKWLDQRKKFQEEAKAKILSSVIENLSTKQERFTFDIGGNNIELNIQHNRFHLVENQPNQDNTSFRFDFDFGFSLDSQNRAIVHLTDIFLQSEKNGKAYHSKLFNGADLIEFMFYFVETLRGYPIQKITEFWQDFPKNKPALSIMFSQFIALKNQGVPLKEAAARTWSGTLYGQRGLRPSEPNIIYKNNVIDEVEVEFVKDENNSTNSVSVTTDSMRSKPFSNVVNQNTVEVNPTIQSNNLAQPVINFVRNIYNWIFKNNTTVNDNKDSKEIAQKAELNDHANYLFNILIKYNKDVEPKALITQNFINLFDLLLSGLGYQNLLAIQKDIDALGDLSIASNLLKTMNNGNISEVKKILKKLAEQEFNSQKAHSIGSDYINIENQEILQRLQGQAHLDYIVYPQAPPGWSAPLEPFEIKSLNKKFKTEEGSVVDVSQIYNSMAMDGFNQYVVPVLQQLRNKYDPTNKAPELLAGSLGYFINAFGGVAKIIVLNKRPTIYDFNQISYKPTFLIEYGKADDEDYYHFMIHDVYHIQAMTTFGQFDDIYKNNPTDESKMMEIIFKRKYFLDKLTEKMKVDENLYKAFNNIWFLLHESQKVSRDTWSINLFSTGFWLSMSDKKWEENFEEIIYNKDIWTDQNLTLQDYQKVKEIILQHAREYRNYLP